MSGGNGIRILKTSGIGAAFAAAALGLSACGASSGGSGAASSAATSPASSMASTAAAGSTASGGKVLGVGSTKLGKILVDDKGRTVYFYEHDKGGTSFCKGACAVNWLPVRAPASVGTISGVTAKLGMTRRSDGSEQLTVAGHPVYTFVGDKAPGQTNGQNLDLNGGLWYAVSPAGAEIEKSASTSSGGSRGGYGY